MNFYNISHFIQLLLLPPAINLLLALIGFLLCCYHLNFGKILLWVALLSLCLLSIPAIAQLLIDRLQGQYPVLNIDHAVSQEKNNHAAIIILGAGNQKAPEYNGRLLCEEGEGRLHYGVYLHRKLQLPIIVSGGSPSPNPQYHDAELMKQELRDNFNLSVL